MREGSGQILRIACLVLAALLLFQFAKIVWRINPLRSVTIPALPALAASTNTPAGTPIADPARKDASSKRAGSETGAPDSLVLTNKLSNKSGTNSVGAKEQKEKGTNLVSSDSAKQTAANNVGPLTPALSPLAGERENVGAVQQKDDFSTNSASYEKITNAETNLSSGVVTNQNATNVATTIAAATSNAVPDKSVVVASESEVAASPNSSSMGETNSAMPADSVGGATNLSLPSPGTNVLLSSTDTKTNAMSGPVSMSIKGKTNQLHVSLGTNGLPMIIAEGTNSAAVSKSKKKGTNSTAPPEMAMAGMSGGPAGMRGGRVPAPELAPEIKARVDRIYESEILGQIMRPLPMALMGIAGNSAFLRSPSGQTGLVKEGDSLGEIKLLRVGINRVLVEQDGQKKELMIFEGYGGESLLPKEKETPK